MEFKQQGGEYFKKGDYTKALQLYTRAILAEPTNAVHYSNRAFCYIKLECYKAAITDAEKCVELDPKFVKGYYRQAAAHAALGNIKDAIAACKKARELVPNDATINKMLTSLKEKLKEQLFFEAIRCEEKPKTISWKSIDASAAHLQVDDNKPIDHSTAMSIFNEMKGCCEYGKCALHLKYATRLVEEAQRILEKRTILQPIKTEDGKKLTIVGDIHGQFYDLITLFQKNGFPAEDNVYLFNGDYVDRGSFGCECLFTLLAFMVACPGSIFLARGNHETRGMNAMYGFEGEVKKKYNDQLYNAIQDMYIQLPFCHLIDDSIFVVHGGIPPTFISLDDIRKIKKCAEPSEGTPENAFIWADPQTENGTSPSMRGSGKAFGPDITMNFLNGNHLEYLVRSHEMKMNGYEWGADGHLITVFSAPNYCDQMKNKGAYIHVITEKKDDKVTHRLENETFEASPHPNIPAMAYASFVF